MPHNITYPVSAYSVKSEPPRPDDTAILVDATRRLLATVQEYQDAVVMADALNACAVETPALEAVQP